MNHQELEQLLISKGFVKDEFCNPALEGFQAYDFWDKENENIATVNILGTMKNGVFATVCDYNPENGDWEPKEISFMHELEDFFKLVIR